MMRERVDDVCSSEVFFILCVFVDLNGILKG